MSIFREIFDNCRHGNVHLTHKLEALTDGVLTAEITLCSPSRDDKVGRVRQSGSGIALDEGQGEEIEHVWISNCHQFLAKRLIVTRQGYLPRGKKTDDALDLRKVLLQQWPYWRRNIRKPQVVAVEIPCHTINLVGVIPVLVVRKLIAHKLRDDDATRETNRQAYDIDRAEQRITGDVSPCDLQIVTKHGAHH